MNVYVDMNGVMTSGLRSEEVSMVASRICGSILGPFPPQIGPVAGVIFDECGYVIFELDCDFDVDNVLLYDALYRWW